MDTLRVLLVESNDEDAGLIEEALEDGLDLAGTEEQPVELLRARSLEGALTLCTQERLDAALLNLTLPDSSGLETLTRFREGVAALPIVILSGRDNDKLALGAVTAGAQDYLRKAEVDSTSVSRALSYAFARYHFGGRQRASHERFRSALDASLVPTLVLSKSCELLYANPAALEGLGAELGELELQGEPPAMEVQGRPLLVRMTVWEGQIARLGVVGGVPRRPTEDDSPTELPEEPDPDDAFEGILSASPAMERLFATVKKIAPTEATALLLGDTGTGKELIARAIHSRSKRKGKFVAVNCGAVPEALIESELFGHVKGAFTGASSEKAGLFRQADGGTLLLDEVADLPASAQVSLLRTLQERTVRSVGGETATSVDVRVIAATSGDLFGEVEAGRFRQDLLYRLDVIRLEVPPLRDRPEDVLHLLAYFLGVHSERHGLEAVEPGPGFLEAMLDYPWPGNVRQLENMAERLVLMGSECVTARQFHELVRPYAPSSIRSSQAEPGLASLDLGGTYAEFMDDAERVYFEELLRRTGGRVLEGAKLAEISRRTLLRKLKKHAIAKEEFR